MFGMGFLQGGRLCRAIFLFQKYELIITLRARCVNRFVYRFRPAREESAFSQKVLAPASAVEYLSGIEFFSLSEKWIV
jgi:hypothetical protein